MLGGITPEMRPRLSADPDVARDRALIRRAPYALPAWVFFAISLHYGVTAAYNLVTGSLGAAWHVTPLMAVRWGGITFLVSLPLMLCAPLLDRLRARGLNWTRPRLDSWLIYYGVYALVSFAGSWLRSALAPWALGFSLAPEIYRQLVWLLAVSHLSTLAAGEVFLSRRRARTAWIAESERLERELARSRAELVEADDRLRREVAEHLHGEVQSRLLMAWALLDQARACDDGATTASLLAQVREQLALLDGMGLPQARELLGDAQADRPLLEVARALVSRFRAVMPVEFVADQAVLAHQERLSPGLRRASRLLLEEALLNAFRHARAERVRVRLAWEGEAALSLTVEDDGVGFAAGASPKALGLSALGSELDALGGSMALVSAPGEGTRVSLRLPLSLPQPEVLA